MKIKSSLCGTLVLLSAALPLSVPARAQNAVTSGIGGRLSVIELRDTTLADALEMIFQAAGNPSHIIDEQAQTVPIQSYSLTNIAWDAAVRNLTQLNGYKVSRNPSGTYLIEPRVIAPVDGAFFPGEGGFPGGPGAFQGQGGNFPGGAPGNPFTRNRFRGNSATQANPSVRTDANPQTRPNFGGRGGGGNTALDPQEGKDYKLIPVRHIYAGGLAQLFANATVIKTEDFVSPGVLGGGGAGGGGGRSGIGGGLGGGGGGIGGGLGGGGGIGGGIGGGGGGIGGGIGGGGGGGGFGGGLGF